MIKMINGNMPVGAGRAAPLYLFVSESGKNPRSPHVAQLLNFTTTGAVIKPDRDI